MVPLLRLVLTALGALAVASVAAAVLPPPSGPVILTVSGAVRNTNGAGVADFGRADLEALPQTVIETRTPWTEGVRRFEGLRLSDLLDHVGGAGGSIRAVALNDYKIDIPAEDAARYGVILALRADGKPMPVREKGPIWLVYPLDSMPESERRMAQPRMIWQLRSLRVE